MHPVADGYAGVAVGILEFVVLGGVGAAEGEASHGTVVLDVGPNPSPVGLRPVVLLVGNCHKLCLAAGKLVDLEPEGEREGLLPDESEVGTLGTEALFGEVNGLRTCTVGIASGVGELDIFVEFHLDVGLLTIGGEGVDFGQCSGSFCTDLHETAEGALRNRTFRAGGIVDRTGKAQVVTAEILQAIHTDGVAFGLEDDVTLAVEERPGGVLVLGVDEAHREALVGLDGGLADFDVVAIGISCGLLVFAPCNFGIALHVE